MPDALYNPTLAHGHRAFARTLDVQCQAHHALPGEACWTLDDHRMVCNERARRAGHRGRITSWRPKAVA